MANRKRKIQMKFGVTAEEKELIMVICHYGIITGFLYSQNCHVWLPP